MFRHQASLGRELLQNQLDFLSQHTHGRVATKLFRHQHSLGRELQELVDIFIRHEQMRVAAMFRHQHSLGRELLQNPLEVLSQQMSGDATTRQCVRNYNSHRTYKLFIIGKG